MGLTVRDLVQRFDSGDIRLPLMQRDYVWKPKKVTKLLDSLYQHWPIGSFYVWQTDSDHPSRARVGAPSKRPLDGFCGFLLDGQQRLTSLSLAIQGEAEAELSHRGFFDLENETFYLRDDANDYETNRGLRSTDRFSFRYRGADGGRHSLYARHRARYLSSQGPG